jgi:pyruvate/2-oxoglutarate dehydrogenase complex dihydrolipoamide dehydrogenase (E3) component
VGDQRIKGENIYINTGTRATVPPIEGIDEVPWMDSAGLLDLKELPHHLIIIGGGYIGVEFGQVFKRFGSQVTIIQSRDQLMPHEDKDVANEIQDILTDEGVEIMHNTRAISVTGTNGDIRLKVKTDEGDKTVKGSHLLLAVGRKPNVERLDLEKAGIKLDPKGYIQTDDYCRTNVEGVFAVGDVNGKGAFTHTSVNDAEVVIDYLFGGKRKVSDRIPVYGLFSDPPLGRVGMTEKEALDSGKRVLKATKEMKTISRAKEMGETKGFAKLLVDAETDLIIGASVLGPGGDEVINMFAAIMHSGIPCRNYREVVLVHPTVAELMPWVLDGLEEI